MPDIECKKMAIKMLKEVSQNYNIMKKGTEEVQPRRR